MRHCIRARTSKAKSQQIKHLSCGKWRGGVWHAACGRVPKRTKRQRLWEASNEAPRLPQIHDRADRRRRRAGAGDLVAGQGPIAPGDAADRLRKRTEQSRHPWRRHQRAGLRSVVELLRPADQPRDEDAAERHALLRQEQIQARARRGHECRRHVGDLQAAQGRDLPGRHAGHRQGRQMVVRPRRHRRRLSDLPDERGLAHQARAVRRRRRPHLPRRFHEEGPADDSRSRRHRAVHHQFRTGEEERHRSRIRGASNTPSSIPSAAAPTR